MVIITEVVYRSHAGLFFRKLKLEWGGIDKCLGVGCKHTRSAKFALKNIFKKNIELGGGGVISQLGGLYPLPPPEGGVTISLEPCTNNCLYLCVWYCVKLQ